MLKYEFHIQGILCQKNQLKRTTDTVSDSQIKRFWEQVHNIINVMSWLSM